MPDLLPDFESSDNAGSTVQASGLVGTSPISVPSVATTAISEFIVHCPENQDVDNRLKISMDGGSNWMTIYPSGHFAWTPKGGAITQSTLEGNDTNVAYEIVLNLEAY